MFHNRLVLVQNVSTLKALTKKTGPTSVEGLCQNVSSRLRMSTSKVLSFALICFRVFTSPNNKFNELTSPLEEEAGILGIKALNFQH